MHTLTWVHTRKKTPMKLQGTFGYLWLRIRMIRQVIPDHPMQLDGKNI